MRHIILLLGVLFFSWGIAAGRLPCKGPNGEAIDFNWTGDGEGIYTVTGKDGLKSSEHIRSDRVTERGGNLSENGYVPGFPGSVHAYVKAQGIALPPPGSSLLPPPVVLPPSFGESRGLFVFPFLKYTKRAWAALTGLGSLLAKVGGAEELASLESMRARPQGAPTEDDKADKPPLIDAMGAGLQETPTEDDQANKLSLVNAMKTEPQETPTGEYYFAELRTAIEYNLLGRMQTPAQENFIRAYYVSLIRLGNAHLLLEDNEWRFVRLRSQNDNGPLLHNNSPLFAYRADIAETFTKIGTVFHLMQLAEKMYVENIGRFGFNRLSLGNLSLKEREEGAKLMGKLGFTPDSSLENAAQQRLTLWEQLTEAFSKTHASALQAYLLYEIVFHHILEILLELNQMELSKPDYYRHRLQTMKFLLSILNSLSSTAFETYRELGFKGEILNMTYASVQNILVRLTTAINPNQSVSRVRVATPQGEEVRKTPGRLRQKIIAQIKLRKTTRLADIKRIITDEDILEWSHLVLLPQDDTTAQEQEATVQQEEEEEQQEEKMEPAPSLPPATIPPPAVGPVEKEAPAVQKAEKRKKRSNAPCLVGGKEESKASGHATNRPVGTQHAGTILSFTHSQQIYTQLSGGNQKLLNALFGIAGYEKVGMTHLNFEGLIKEIAKHMASLGIAAKNVKQFSDEAKNRIHAAHASDKGKKLPANYLDILCTTFIWWGMVPPAWQGPVNYKEAMALENYLNRATWHIWHGLMKTEDLLPCIRKDLLPTLPSSK